MLHVKGINVAHGIKLSIKGPREGVNILGYLNELTIIPRDLINESQKTECQGDVM